MTWAYEQDVKPAAAKFVLVTLANNANGEGYCWPGQQRLARLTGMSERALRDNIIALEEAGLIRRERRHRKSGSRSSDGYWLVGFADDLPAESAGNQPADIAGSDEDNRQNLPVDYRQISPNLPADSAAGSIYRNEPLVEPSDTEPLDIAASAAQRPEHPQDIHWDTMVEIHGFSPTRDTPEHGRWNKAAGIWRKLNATPDDMRLAAMLYRQEHRDVAFTVMALASNAERLLRGHKPEPPPRIEDIKNPMVRAALTADLSDIEAELREKATNGRTPRQIQGPFSGPREFPADARRLGAGERTEGRDVLPAPRRERRA